MIIRRATASDAEPIAQVHVLGWRTAYREILPVDFMNSLSVEARLAQWKGRLDQPDPEEAIFVAERDGQIVGFANAGPEREGDLQFEGELYAIYLLENHRGQGLGRRLVRAAVESLLARSR